MIAVNLEADNPEFDAIFGSIEIVSEGLSLNVGPTYVDTFFFALSDCLRFLPRNGEYKADTIDEPTDLVARRQNEKIELCYGEQFLSLDYDQLCVNFLESWVQLRNKISNWETGMYPKLEENVAILQRRLTCS